jgi:23S rRNA (guanosine2251-2'-O)-methyltransferase
MAETAETVVWGVHEVIGALEAGHAVSRIYLAREVSGGHIERIKALARQRKIPFQFIDVGKLGRLAGTRDHQDVVARISPVAYTPFASLLENAEGQKRTVVVPEQIQFARNLGMIARTAVGAGVDAMLLPTRGGRLVNDEVVQASSGALFKLPLVASANLSADLRRLKDAGYWVYGLDAGAPQTIFEVDWPLRRVLVVGNESRGLRPSTRKQVDALVRIPLAGELESLNVAVALGVALFDIVRSDSGSGGGG